MSVLLRHSRDLPSPDAYDAWIAVAGARRPLDTGTEIADVARQLEDAFDSIAGDWLAFARELGSEKSAELSHVPACAANVSDIGEMFAWTRIVEDIARDKDRRSLVVCDDPWLFRHLREVCPVQSGRPPRLAARRIALCLRGYGVRLKYAIRAAADIVRLHGHRHMASAGGAWLLVYGHPSSEASGQDGYFGDLPLRIPSLLRALHVDCGRVRALDLARDGKVASLRAWGSFLALVMLPFARWRPSGASRRGKYGWLVRRAAALEAGTAQPAAIKWQILCQRAWLAVTRPAIVAWPWENHSWERVLVRDARAAGVRTLGYQHSVIGRQMLNYSPRSCEAGAEVLPDMILCTGQSTLEQLTAHGVPRDRLIIGGALRFPRAPEVRYDPAAPIFVALPFDHDVAAEMMTAIAGCSALGREFAVRDHPMTPFAIRPGGHIRRANGPLGKQGAVSAVLYAATSVGLEALIAGLPTLRFRSRAHMSLDVLPPGIDVPATDLQSLQRALLEVRTPAPVDRDRIFAASDLNTWRAHLEAA